MNESSIVMPLVKKLKAKDLEVRLEVLKTLAEVGDYRSVKFIIEALQDENREIRSYAEKALNMIKDIRALKPLADGLRNKDKGIQSSVAKILANKGKIAVWPLLDAIPEPYWFTSDETWHYVNGVIMTFGYLNDPIFAWIFAKYLRYIKSEDEARRALNKLPHVPTEPLIDSLAIWRHGRFVAQLLERNGWRPQNSRDQIHLMVATRDGDNLRRNWELTKEVLLADVGKKEYWFIENALFAFIGIGNKEIIPVLVKKLNENGNKTMAEAFLNCYHQELGDAARAWAASHGYTITSGGGAHPVSWGGM